MRDRQTDRQRVGDLDKRVQHHRSKKASAKHTRWMLLNFITAKRHVCCNLVRVFSNYFPVSFVTKSIRALRHRTCYYGLTSSNPIVVAGQIDVTYNDNSNNTCEPSS